MEDQIYEYHLEIVQCRKKEYDISLSRRNITATNSFDLVCILKTIDDKCICTYKSVEKCDLSANFGLYTFRVLETGLYWSIHQFGDIKICTDNSIIFHQVGVKSPIGNYSLTFNTSNTLYIQSLIVTSVRLECPLCIITGFLSTDSLHSDTTIVNDGVLGANYIDGKGILINRNIIKCDNSFIRISTFKNTKNDKTEQYGKIEGTTLHLHSKVSKNNKGCEISVDSLQFESFTNSIEFTNNGTIRSKSTNITRGIVNNNGKWSCDSIHIDNQEFINGKDGELIVRKKFTLNTKLTNNGKVSSYKSVAIGELGSGPTRFDNYGTWTHEGDIQLGHFDEDEKGNTIHISNKKNAKIVWTNGECISVPKQTIGCLNRGTWIFDSVKGSTMMSITNKGFFQLKDSQMEVNSTTNTPKCKVILCPKSQISISLYIYNMGYFEGGYIRIISPTSLSLLENEGTMIVKGILGKGRFTNSGHLTLYGTGNDSAIIDIDELRNESEIIFNYTTVTENNKEIRNINGGSIISTDHFITSQGLIRNDGIWHHTGDLSLGLTKIINNATGNIFWEQGKWSTIKSEGEENIKYVDRNLQYIKQDRSVITIVKRENEIAPQSLIQYTNKGKWVFKDISGYGCINLINEGIINITDKTYIWIDQFYSSPKSQITLFPSTNLRCHQILNMGLFQSDQIYMNSSEFINCGIVNVSSLVGYDGNFRNMNQLNMIGSVIVSTILSCSNLDNGYSTDNKVAKKMILEYKKVNLPLLSPHFNGSYILVGKGYFSLTNHKNGQIDTGDYFKAVKSNFFYNHGVWNHKGEIEFEESNIRNKGTIDFEGSFTGNRLEIQNFKEGSWRLHTGSIYFNEIMFGNLGTMFWKYVTLSISMKNPIENKGTLVLGGITCNRLLDINNKGTLELDSGKLYFSVLNNYKTLVFKGGCYSIKNLSNKGTIVFKSRKWTITREQLPESKSKYYYNQDGYLQITSNFTDNGIIESTYQLILDYFIIPHNPKLKNGFVLKEIPSLNNLVKIGCIKISSWYDMPEKYLGENEICVKKEYNTIMVKYRLRDMFGNPKAKNGVIEDWFLVGFNMWDTKFYSNEVEQYAPQILKDLLDKKYIRSPISITTTINKDYSPNKEYIFNNISYLNLTIDGDFTLFHKLYAGSIKLTVNGGLVFNKNDKSLSSLAATDGELTIVAYWIDAQWGQIYGAKDTSIKSTEGDIEVGHHVEVSYSTEKKLGCTFGYTTVVMNKWAVTNYYEVNGSYIHTGGKLILRSASNIDLNYSQIYSKNEASFTASNNIEAIRAIINGNSTCCWKAKYVYIGRQPQRHLCIGWMSSGYPCVYGYAAMSDQSEIHYQSTITFDTPKLKVVASTITSGQSIVIKKNSISYDSVSIKEGHKNPSSVELCNYGITWGTQGPCNHQFTNKILAGQNISVDMDKINVKGMLNASTLTFTSTESVTFQNGSKTRETVQQTTIVIDITTFAQNMTKLGGFLTLNDDNEIKPTFTSEKPYIFTQNQTIYLVPQDDPNDFRSPLRYIDPMRFMTSDMWNTLLQQAMTLYLGKVSFKDNNRKNCCNNQHKILCQFTEEWCKRMGRNHIFSEELDTLNKAIYIKQKVDKDNKTYLHTLVAAPKEDINPYQSDGDITGDKLTVKSGKDIRFENTRVVIDDDINTEAEGDTEVITTTTTTFFKDAGITIITTKADPQAILKANSINMKGKGNLTHTGSYTEANILTEDFNGTITENTVVESQTIISESSKDGFFRSSHSISIDTNTSHVPTVKNVNNYNSTSKSGITHSGSIHQGNQHYKAPYLKSTPKMSSNVHYSGSDRDVVFGSSQESNSYQEHQTISQPIYHGDTIIFECPNIDIKGADIESNLVDMSKANNISLGPEIVPSSYSNQNKGGTSFSSYDIGCSGWKKDVLPTRIR